MKNNVNGFVFIYSKIKNFFFNCFSVKRRVTKNTLRKSEKVQVNINDEYHKAYSGVTRWQTI